MEILYFRGYPQSLLKYATNMSLAVTSQVTTSSRKLIIRTHMRSRTTEDAYYLILKTEALKILIG
ncbi:hypothetical protein DU86_02540 [Methanosarcina mazei]|uniref:Uncharacterized protein n=1 Tax=Methanosarcina mazei TaxID=2209 RepID=A0A0F8N2V8_METMZ|nr:hypothetical protein DU47_08120 [Methanosarcina mazei]KKG53226.1 hypothetical protein DU33_16250 [Methanosarcina mazei]KKG64989.1 hypothetical protein DU45_04190 [Methanosarcina mazei]KKG65317.1 hypothetical protein DU67_12915 [Methanosarcina mazei]KKG74514.1 hypothetical protein DU46_07035 [Methanosarcina mazei]